MVFWETAVNNQIPVRKYFLFKLKIIKYPGKKFIFFNS